MSTSFPSFCPKTTNSLWFSLGDYNDETDINMLEEKYENWLKNVVEKDKDAAYIGKKSEIVLQNEVDVEGESEASEEEEEDLNGYPDSPEEQNAGLQADIDMDGGEEEADDNSWML